MSFRLKRIFCLAVQMLLSAVSYANTPEDTIWEYADGNLRLQWNLATDQAKLLAGPVTVWQGSLLPAFWIRDAAGEQRYLKATPDAAHAVTEQGRLTLPLQWGASAKGKLIVEKAAWGLRFRELRLEWASQPPAIIEMYIGTSELKGANVKPTWDRPFMPGWQAPGYCVPGARSGTVQSYFRNWDLGHAAIPLGNFGPSLGTPYGAGFPRPFLFAAMGGNQGWINLGAGSVPDAAMVLKMQSARGCFQYLYREDLWGASPNRERVWEDLLRITIDSSAIGAFQKYYSSFPIPQKAGPAHAVSVWNTWGMWRKQKYPIRPIADFMQQMQNEVMVLDDPWESSQGSGKPNLERFPDFYADLAYIRSRGVGIGLWETMGWIKDTAACGLHSTELIVDRQGKPCMANWNFDPEGDAFYCLDVSVPRARAFLQERTRKIMQELKPALLKLDFGYGLPSPHMGVPRNPAYRGERYCFELLQLIAQAARSVDPRVIIMYYGISPLWTPLVDMVSLDDQGDMWYDIQSGHQQWSVWASLLSRYGVALSGSSGYNWELDNEVLMNSMILGSPGAVLPIVLDNGDAVPEQYLNRRLAVNKWRRRTLQWEPRWFNSSTGNMDGPPRLHCWGRTELMNGKKILTALVLREPSPPPLAGIRWSGAWGLISQDDRDITVSRKLALIPFSAGRLSLPLPHKPGRVMRMNIHGTSAYNSWSWENGLLTITVTTAALKDIAGFLVEQGPAYP